MDRFLYCGWLDVIEIILKSVAISAAGLFVIISVGSLGSIKESLERSNESAKLIGESQILISKQQIDIAERLDRIEKRLSELEPAND